MSKPRKAKQVQFEIKATPEVADAIARNMHLAVLRIGGPKPRKRARWLIEKFLATPPGDLSPGDVMNRQHELAGLVWMWMFEQGSPHTSVLHFDTNPGTLRTAWERVGDLVRRWVAGEAVALPPIEATLERQKDGDDLRGKISRSAAGPSNNLLLAVAHLLTDPAVRVRECPECGKLFVPERRQRRHLLCARQARDAKRPDRGKRKKKGETR